MIVLDTTVLVYAIGGAHQLREPCERVIAAIRDGEVAATTTIEVIQEFAHVRARRHGAPEAADRAREAAVYLGPLIRPTEADLRDGLTLFANYEALGAFGAVLAATARNAVHVTGLMSADAAFGGVPGLNHLAPGSL